MAGNGLFLTIEGIDSSGKETQAKRLVARLEDKFEQVKYVEFPTYDSNFGQLVGRYLRGNYGKIEDMPEEIVSLLFALDRYQYKQEFEEFLQEGGILVANRYSQSNYAFQAAKCSAETRDGFLQWITEVESRLPQPDHVLLLDVPPRIARKLLKNRKKQKYLENETDNVDIHEEDLKFQQQVAEVYRQLQEKRSNWMRVEATENGELLSIERIEDKVWSAVKGILRERSLL